MSLAEFTGRVVTPIAFFLWGVALGMPREYAPRSPGDSWWQRPWVVGGIFALVIGLIGFPFGSDSGVIAMLVILLAVVPIALGGAFAWWLRRKPPRGTAETAASPHPTDLD